MSEPPPVVLLVEDDPDVAAYTGTVLRHLAGRLEDHGGGHPSNGTARPPDRPRSPPGREPPAE